MTDHQITEPSCDSHQMDRAENLFKVLASRPRLEVVCWLQSEPDVERSVTEIQEKLGDLSQSAVSQHLARLRTAGVLKARRHRQAMFYSLADKRIGRQVFAFMQLC